jgi:hypothetical protein
MKLLGVRLSLLLSGHPSRLGVVTFESIRWRLNRRLLYHGRQDRWVSILMNCGDSRLSIQSIQRRRDPRVVKWAHHPAFEKLSVESIRANYHRVSMYG